MNDRPYFLTHDNLECYRAKKRMPPSFRFLKSEPGAGEYVLQRWTTDEYDQLYDDLLVLEGEARRLHRDNDRLLGEAIDLGNQLTAQDNQVQVLANGWMEVLPRLDGARERALRLWRGWLTHRHGIRQANARGYRLGDVRPYLTMDRREHAA